MSNLPFHDLKTLLAGRWQIPLALAAALTGAAALYRLIPAAPKAEFAALLADVAFLEQAGNPVAAADALKNLLEMEPPLPPEQQAELHQRLADLLYRMEEGQPRHSVANLKALLRHDDEARRLGRPGTTATRFQAASAKLWLGREDEVLTEYRRLLESDLSGDDRRTVVTTLVKLLERRPEAKAQRTDLLNGLLADATLGPEYVWWALRHALADALDAHDAQRARELLDKYRDRLATSDVKPYLEYLNAYVLVNEGQAAAAEPLVRWVDEALSAGEPRGRTLDDFGHLPSLNRALLGQIHLAQGRPSDALEAFEDARAMQTGPELRIGACVGRGRALAALGRHAEARASFAEALGGLRLYPERRRQTIEQLKHELLRLYDERQAHEDFVSALGYAAMAGMLRDLESAAEAVGAADEVITATAPAVEADPLAFDLVAKGAEYLTFDEPRLSAFLWAGAQEYDRRGRLEDLRRALELFVAGRSDDPRMPRALLLLGQACEGTGQLDEARRWYQMVRTLYPALEDAARAQVATARVLISLGSSQFAAAESLLTELLNGDNIAPEAPAFREALLAICELYYHQGRYADAISRLYDFCALYPHDAERFRARFMLANAHRRSAETRRAAAPEGVSASAAEAESAARLRTAAEQFGKLLAELEGEAAAEDVDLYARLALLYRGDCLLELNEPETLREALRTYGLAGARYGNDPTVLVANVQIANVCLRLGDLPEAARALERARWLLRTIPDVAYERRRLGGRAHWEQYLNTVLSSDLFRDVFASR